MRKFLFLILLLICSCCICSCSVEDNNLKHYSFDDSDILVSIINENCKYILKDWWFDSKEISFGDSYLLNDYELTDEQKAEARKSEISFYNWEKEKYIYICNWQKNVYSENAILPSCYASRVVSEALFYDIYDESIIGVMREDAQSMICKLITSVVKFHCSNSINGWGHCWQGALWAEMLGLSAYYMRDFIDKSDWECVLNMVLSEADYVINTVGVSFYRDHNGNVDEKYTGDSQSETVAWNATIIALAQLLTNRESDYYIDSLIHFCVSSMARPSDIKSEKMVDNIKLNALEGSNLNDDGTVINHGKYHIDYMASPIESLAECYIVLKLCDKIDLECLKFNVDSIYRALVDNDLGAYDETKKNHHFYERTDDNYPSCFTNMPGENEWGSYRQANYYLVDIYSHIIKADESLPNELKAIKWAHCRLIEIKRMVERSDDGKIYQEGEEYFASGQVYAMACLTQSFSLLANFYKI